MTEPIFYIDRSHIREGKLEEVKAGMRDLAAFVEANEAQVIAYNFFIDEAEATMTVIAVHPDAASMELQMAIGGARFRGFADLIKLQSIDVYGRVSETVLGQLRTKAEMLGTGTETVHNRQAGFTRLEPVRTQG